VDNNEYLDLSSFRLPYDATTEKIRNVIFVNNESYDTILVLNSGCILAKVELDSNGRVILAHYRKSTLKMNAFCVDKATG